MNCPKLILDRIIDASNKRELKSFGTTLTKKESTQKRKKIKQIVENKDNYLSFEITNNKITKLVIALLINDVFNGSLIVLLHFELENSQLNKKNVQEEITKIKAHLKDKEDKIFIEIPVYEQKLKRIFQSVNIQHFGDFLIGNVDAGLKHLSREITKYDLSKFELKPMSYNKDIKSVMNLEKKAHDKDNTTLITYDNKKKIEEMKKYYKQMCKEKSAWLLTCNKKVVGVVGTLSKMKHQKTDHMGTIVLDPKFQGRGLSKLLYYTALNNMKESSTKQYSGYTSTTRVIKFAKKLKRKRVSYLMQSI